MNGNKRRAGKRNLKRLDTCHTLCFYVQPQTVYPPLTASSRRFIIEADEEKQSIRYPDGHRGVSDRKQPVFGIFSAKTDDAAFLHRTRFARRSKNRRVWWHSISMLEHLEHLDVNHISYTNHHRFNYMPLAKYKTEEWLTIAQKVINLVTFMRS